jgi:hypothetical protein
MNIDRKSQEQLINEAKALADETMRHAHLGESHIIQSNALLIESNARVEGEIGNLSKAIKTFNRKADRQATVMIKLTWVIAGLTFLLFVGLIIQLIIGK